MYNTIETNIFAKDSNIQSEHSEKKKCMRCVFDPLIFCILLALLFSILFIFIYYLIIVGLPVIQNFNYLISVTIPSEIAFYHQLLVYHNQTISRVEQEVVKYLEVSRIVANKKTLDTLDRVISNTNVITSKLNITQIQSDLTSIVNTLNKIFPH